MLRERDTEAAESKLYDPEHGYIAPVNLAAAPQEVELRSTQWADAETFTLLLEYRYSPADGDGYSENMTLTVQRAAGGLHFLSCAFAEG